MPPRQIRFVTACQQLLALGVVVAALTPAASVVSLDVARERPEDALGADLGGGSEALLSAYAREAGRPSRVAGTAVTPVVREYPLADAASGARSEPDGPGRAHSVTSAPEPVSGYGAVGVTWAPGSSIPEDDLTVRVRTRTAQTWSPWMGVDYDAEHGPTPGSAEARRARPGTDALLVGDVDDVQVQVATRGRDLPADLRLAVIGPGRADRTVLAHPALHTETGEDAGRPTAGSHAGQPPAVRLSAAAYTPKPEIYSRAQWGADESLRDPGSLRYFEVHAGFVHHTVNANDYTRDDVPAIIRGIYAYHTQSRGWSDIGYNFLVDRFGRIWEGRYGGIDRPVVGAHTLDYNDHAFAMAAIGNYEDVQPSHATLQAYGALFAWKLSLHGVAASSAAQRVGARTLPAINGHRDVAATACPGRYLAARLPEIRQLAAAAQQGWAGRELESNLASSAHPDLVVRRARDGRTFVIPTGGLTAFTGGGVAADHLPSGSSVVPTPDVTGDGRADLVVRLADGTARIRPGTASATFGPARPRVVRGFVGHSLITAVGDVDGDHHHDLVARNNDTQRLDTFLGRGNGTFAVRRSANTWAGYDQLAGVGDLDGDGHRDVVGRDRRGRLWLHPGTGSGRFGARHAVPGSWRRYSAIAGVGDLTGDGRPDLVLRRHGTRDGYVLPARGRGRFGHVLGPLTGFRKLGPVLGAVQVGGTDAVDVLFRSGASVVVMRNKGTTETRPRIATGVRAAGARGLYNAGDWDRDGHGDLITRSRSGSLFLHRGDGQGHFGSALRIGTGFGSVRLLAAVGDVTGDGSPDLMGQPAGSAVRIYPGRGLAGMGPGYVAHRAIRAGRQVGVGRWNGDGAPDSLFVRKGRPVLYAGNGPGGLTGATRLGLDLRRYDWVIGVSDVTVTGHADLVVREKATGYLWLIPGTRTGFGPRRFLAEGMGGYDLAG